MGSSSSDARILCDSVVDPLAFSSLYERHLPAVAKYVARRIGNGLVDDVTAGVFVRAFRARAAFRDEHGSALPWLLGIANQIITVPSIDYRQYPDGINGSDGADITAGFTSTSARGLAAELKLGALPVTLKLICTATPCRTP